MTLLAYVVRELRHDGGLWMVSDTEKTPETPPGSEAAGRKTWLKSVAAITFLGFLIGAVIFSQSIKNKAKIGQPAPVWIAEDLEGKEVSLTDFLGQPILLNLWTTWCISCKEETPALQAFHERYGDRIKVIGLDVKEPVDTIKEYMKMTGTTYTVVRDKIGKVTGPYNIRGYPETWFIDEKGIARVYWEGPMTFEQMQEFYRQTTGKDIDGAGVGPIRPGDRLTSVTVLLDAERGGSDPSGGRMAVFAATTKGLYKASLTPGGGLGLASSSARNRWERVQSPVLKGEITALLAPPRTPGLIFAAGPEFGLARSTDGGRTWSRLEQGFSGGDIIRAMASDPSGRMIYVWVSGKGLYMGTDGGNAWQAVRSTISAEAPVSALAVDPSKPERLLAGGEGGALVSSDGGKTWIEARLHEVIYTIDTKPSVFGIAFDADNPKIVYYATNKGVWKSTDGGGTARWLKGSHARLINSVSIAAGAGGSLVAAAPNGDIYASDDGGSTWRLLTK